MDCTFNSFLKKNKAQKQFLIQWKLTIIIEEIIECKFKYFENPIKCLNLFQTQEITMDLGK
jgi:hypothetical protein